MASENFILQEKTLGQLLRETAAKLPDNEALIHYEKGTRWTWAGLNAEVDRLAKSLLALGVTHGDKVGVWATNNPYWVPLMFATARIGAILVTVNTSYQDKELKYLLEQSDCSTLFMSGSYRDHDFMKILRMVVPEVDTRKKDDLRCDSLPFLRRIVTFDGEVGPGYYGLEEILALADSITDEQYKAAEARVKPHDVVNMQYTSGTTGFPKGVMLTHVNILNNGYWIGYHQKQTSKDRICLPVPLFHCFGCVLGVMAFVNHGVTMVVMEAFNAVNVLAAINKEKCTGIYGVPTMFLALLENKNFKQTDFSHMRTGIMAGSVCPAPLMRRVIADMNITELTICYGLTEGSPVMTQTTTEDNFERKTGTVGKAMPGIEVKVVNPDNGEEVPRGNPGEVICRGYNVMKGYYKMPEATAEVIDGQGFLHSGDLGIMDEDGYLVITGRIKDMIIRGGENIYPKELEEFFSCMEGVSDVQVVSVPSYKYGEEAAAFIIPKPGAELTPVKMRAYCKGKIAWHKVPRYFAFVESYPLTGSGKVQKFKLREMAAEMFPDPHLKKAGK